MAAALLTDLPPIDTAIEVASIHPQFRYVYDEIRSAWWLAWVGDHHAPLQLGSPGGLLPVQSPWEIKLLCQLVDEGGGRVLPGPSSNAVAEEYLRLRLNPRQAARDQQLAEMEAERAEERRQERETEEIVIDVAETSERIMRRRSHDDSPGGGLDRAGRDAELRRLPDQYRAWLEVEDRTEKEEDVELARERKVIGANADFSRLHNFEEGTLLPPGVIADGKEQQQ